MGSGTNIILPTNARPVTSYDPLSYKSHDGFSGTAMYIRLEYHRCFDLDFHDEARKTEVVSLLL